MTPCPLVLSLLLSVTPDPMARVRGSRVTFSCLGFQDRICGKADHFQSSFSHQRPRKEKTCLPWGPKERKKYNQELRCGVGGRKAHCMQSL